MQMSYALPSIFCVCAAAIFRHTGCFRFAALVPNIGMILKPSARAPVMSARNAPSPPMRAGTV